MMYTQEEMVDVIIQMEKNKYIYKYLDLKEDLLLLERKLLTNECNLRTMGVHGIADSYQEIRYFVRENIMSKINVELRNENEKETNTLQVR